MNEAKTVSIWCIWSLVCSWTTFSLVTHYERPEYLPIMVITWICVSIIIACQYGGDPDRNLLKKLSEDETLSEEHRRKIKKRIEE